MNSFFHDHSVVVGWALAISLPVLFGLCCIVLWFLAKARNARVVAGGGTGWSNATFVGGAVTMGILFMAALLIGLHGAIKETLLKEREVENLRDAGGEITAMRGEVADIRTNVPSIVRAGMLITESNRIFAESNMVSIIAEKFGEMESNNAIRFADLETKAMGHEILVSNLTVAVSQMKSDHIDDKVEQDIIHDIVMDMRTNQIRHGKMIDKLAEATVTPIPGEQSPSSLLSIGTTGPSVATIAASRQQWVIEALTNLNARLKIVEDQGAATVGSFSNYQAMLDELSKRPVGTGGTTVLVTNVINLPAAIVSQAPQQQAMAQVQQTQPAPQVQATVASATSPANPGGMIAGLGTSTITVTNVMATPRTHILWTLGLAKRSSRSYLASVTIQYLNGQYTPEQMQQLGYEVLNRFNKTSGLYFVQRDPTEQSVHKDAINDMCDALADVIGDNHSVQVVTGWVRPEQGIPIQHQVVGPGPQQRTVHPWIGNSSGVSVPASSASPSAPPQVAVTQ